jgi:DNA-binding MarR family transcriptional regulator
MSSVEHSPAPASGPGAVAALDDAWESFFGAIRRARVRAAKQATPGITIAQWTLLRPLEERDGIPVGELAAGAGVTAPTASRMLDALEREGLVARAHSATDRRCVAVTLTAAGRRDVGERSAEMAAMRRDIFSTFTPDERELAARLLTRIGAAIEEHL